MLKPLLFGVITCLLCSCGDTGKDNDATDTGTGTTAQAGIAAPKPLTFKVDAVYPHDPSAFTQGLQWFNGKLYEGTGLNEESRLRIVDLKTGKVEKNYLVPDTSIFGEGITILNNKIYQLTWQSHKVFVYNVSDITKPIETLNWSREGWGITNDGTHLIVSDGSSNIYYVNPADFKVLKIISVTDNNGTVDMLNELELVKGELFANRWQTNYIMRIDTANGHITGKMDLTGLLEQYDAAEINSDTNVLNGIAYDSSRNKLLITGKKWPKLFEISLNP